MHFELLYLILSLFIGIASISVTLIFLIISKDKLYIGTLLFFVPFTFLIIEKIITDYIVINKLNSGDFYWLISNIVNTLTFRLLYFTLPFFIHEIVSAAHKKIKNIIFFILSSVIILIEETCIFVFFSLYPNSWQAYLDLGLWNRIIDSLFVAIIIYLIIILIINYKKIDNKYFKKIARDLFIITIITFPFITLNVIGYYFEEIGIIPNFIYNYYYVILLPSISIILTIHIIGYFLNRLNKKVELKPDENLFDKYDITDREKEIIYLILKGYNNKQIGYNLFISVSTVKKHIYSIFGKTKVKNRFELIAFFKKV